MSAMKQQLQERLNDLKQEFASGQQVLADLQAKQAEVQNTLLRIQGAIQVLEEVLANEDPMAAASLSDPVPQQPAEVSMNAHD
jgi:uncharacterized coiled-coil protein SlyX